MKTTTAVILLSALTKAQPFALLNEPKDLKNEDIVTDAPLAVSLDKNKDKVKSSEPTNDETVSPNSREANPWYGYYGYADRRPCFCYGYGYGFYGRKRSAEAGYLGNGYGKREAVNTKMIQKIKNRLFKLYLTKPN